MTPLELVLVGAIGGAVVGSVIGTLRWLFAQQWHRGAALGDARVEACVLNDDEFRCATGGEDVCD
jgi:hypothetical protein